MKYYVSFFAAVLLLASCKNEKEETVTEETTVEKPVALSFENKEYEQKTTLPGKDPKTYVSISVPDAVGGSSVVADTINNKIFHVVRSIVYFGEKPTDAKSYKELMASFIGSYDELAKKYPDDPMSWEAKIKATVDYKTDSIINIKLHNYMFTGGAHGYEGDRSLLFNARTGRSLVYSDIFKDEKAFTAFAEKKFRAKYKIPAGKPINATGLMFEGEKFALPQNIFFKENGILLYYNAYEVAAYAEQQKEVMIPYSEADAFLKMK
ncbi:DUF3298 and DUF4163 domain-containing protein [Flavobacterium zepuense]|uniref:DUF3298 and DUF4163 domain-containing protein n=1 Tax=Flavobacterium zepuense TaxID=2593302 RepID=A0A552UWX1_9FLAO|nr:DUF3298 and DUF4163 domain-containing protein [Flavobacterium zepuense]TRW22718.1 DUF3298 and DUF4163 domain-containing protein [Flavobacterium zepuense]